MLIAFDAIAVPGKDTILHTKISALYYLLHPFRNKFIIEYFLGTKMIGMTKTSIGKLSSISYNFKAPGIYRIDVILKNGGKVKMKSTAGVFCSDMKRPALISDIDHTIADISWPGLLLLPNRYICPFCDAPGVLETIYKQYDIIYLTRREDLLLDKTRRWLSKNAFPLGPVFMWDFWSEPLRAEKYKTKVIRRLKRRWNHIVLGIGDKQSDINAYVKNGLRSILISRNKSRVKGASAVVQGWKEIGDLVLQCSGK